VYKVREAIKEGRSLDVEILNYRRDGVAFWNRFRFGSDAQHDHTAIELLADIVDCCVCVFRTQNPSRAQEGKDNR
jgi:hypothetical protein